MMTIKELADRCQVHYNTMRKWLIDNDVPKANESRNSPFILNNEVIKNAEFHFLGEDVEEIIKEEKTKEIDSDLVSHLVSQRNVKDTQIVKQQEQIDHLQKLLENQQILTLKAQGRVERLENKAEEENEEIKNIDLEIELEEKLTIWEKIFKRNK